MTSPIEFGSTCTCESWCDGSICWLPQQRELTRLLAAWRLRNPSPTYRISTDAARLGRRDLSWDPSRRALWDLLAAPGPWRQAYEVGEEQVRMLQSLGDGSTESFTVEPAAKAVPLVEPARQRLPALALA